MVVLVVGRGGDGGGRRERRREGRERRVNMCQGISYLLFYTSLFTIVLFQSLFLPLREWPGGLQVHY